MACTKFVLNLDRTSDVKLIILINGFQKKSQKTPKKEIDKAIKIKKQYFDEKAK